MSPSRLWLISVTAGPLFGGDCGVFIKGFSHQQVSLASLDFQLRSGFVYHRGVLLFAQRKPR